jgi:hypothetical protein
MQQWKNLKVPLRVVQVVRVHATHIPWKDSSASISAVTRVRNRCDIVWTQGLKPSEDLPFVSRQSFSSDYNPPGSVSWRSAGCWERRTGAGRLVPSTILYNTVWTFPWRKTSKLSACGSPRFRSLRKYKKLIELGYASERTRGEARTPVGILQEGGYSVALAPRASQEG